jgi:hypothetical protein
LPTPKRCIAARPAAGRGFHRHDELHARPTVVSEAGDKVEVDAKGLGRVTRTRRQYQAPPARGESPVVGLRPETLTLLHDDQKAAERETEGTIDEVIYYGDMTYYDVERPQASDH